jgi:hypothetical protein
MPQNRTGRFGAGMIGLLLPSTGLAQPATPLHASYDTYAAGLRVAAVDSGFTVGPKSYEMSLSYQTTGMAGLFLSGHQSDHVSGTFLGRQVVPWRFLGQGHWHGADRIADIEYQQGRPVIRQLEPSNQSEREPVPDSLQASSIDTLSALIQLVRTVAETGRCEANVRTYDGRRAVALEAHTVGDEMLEPTGRSVFSGKALHCEFSGRMLAGFKFDDDRARDGRPMHGSAWMAPVVPGGPPLPVRMSFETKWFGDATMYLTRVGPGADLKVARGN